MVVVGVLDNAGVSVDVEVAVGVLDSVGVSVGVGVDVSVEVKVGQNSPRQTFWKRA